MHATPLLLACALTALASAQDCTPPLASSHAPHGDFGASLGASGDLLVVGAPLSDRLPPSTAGAAPYGRAELFSYDPVTTAWVPGAVLAPSPTPLTVLNEEGFGSSVAIGATTLFFAWPDDITGGNGTVRPFRRAATGPGWVEEDPIRPPAHTATGRFGVSVAAHGELVVVGERLGEGRAHVYARSAITDGWHHLQTILPPPASFSNGTFGRSVALSGEWLFVGDPGHDGAIPANGFVHAYRWSSAHGEFRHVQRLAAQNSSSARPDGFGTSLDAEPGRLFVGAPREPNAANTSVGAAYVFVPSALAPWLQWQRLAPPSLADGAGFGASIDGTRDALLVGAPRDRDSTGNRPGFAYLFERDPVTDHWDASGRYTAPSTSFVNAPRAAEAVAVGHWHAALGAPGAELVRATPAFPTRDVDVDNALDSCEALHDPTPCPALPNASGEVGRIHVDGTLDVGAANTHLWCDRLTPDSFGYFIVSRTFEVQPPPPGANQFGVLCLGGHVGRYVGNVLHSAAAGRVDLVIDPLRIPQPNGFVAAQPGESWYFEYWHRDDHAVHGRVTAFTETARVTFE